ncbi:zinc-binding dehydrogenase [Nocardia sp. NPDC004568]|uniref:zinc-binding dehydrogenase n=1 Tax=Nocardia sp. NPDC004568 TaxID=3154551 RepID=UPI0033A336C8
MMIVPPGLAARDHGVFLFAVTGDLAEQGRILDQVSRLVDTGILTTTATTTLGTINAEHLREAHRVLEAGKAVGKITLAGFRPAGVQQPSTLCDQHLLGVHSRWLTLPSFDERISSAMRKTLWCSTFQQGEQSA